MPSSQETKHTAISGPLEVDQHGLGIWAPSLKGGKTKVLDIRAWGYLTGHGGGALAMSHDDAEAAQRAFGATVCDRFNSHDALVAALKRMVAAIDGTREAAPDWRMSIAMQVAWREARAALQRAGE